jgi:hypothetical protein
MIRATLTFEASGTASTHKKAPQKDCAYSEHRAVAAKVVF